MIESGQKKDIRRRYQCGYYTIPIIIDTYNLSRKEVVAILREEPSAIDEFRMQIELLDFLGRRRVSDE